MARSHKPSVWIEKRKAGSGFVTWRVVFERDERRFPILTCGPEKEFACRIRDTLRLKLYEREARLERLIAEFVAGTITNKVFADDVLAYLSSEKAPDRHAAADAPATRTVGDLHDAYLKESRRDKAPRSVEIDEAALGRLAVHFGRDLPLEQLVPARIREFADGMKGRRGRKEDAELVELGKTSVAMYLFAVRAATNRAREVYEWITHDPFKKVEIYRVGSKGRFIHDDEFHKVQPLAELKIRAGRSLWEFLDVLRRQGLRSGAVEALDGRMVNHATRHLHLIKPARLGIQREAELKNTELYAPIHKAVWPIFRDAPKEGRIFAGWTRDGVAKELRKICLKVKLTPFRPHDLKHTFVTNYLKGGGTIDMCSAITGTSTMMLRRVYKHLENRVPAAEMNRVEYSSPPTPHKKKTARA